VAEAGFQAGPAGRVASAAVDPWAWAGPEGTVLPDLEVSGLSEAALASPEVAPTAESTEAAKKACPVAVLTACRAESQAELPEACPAVSQAEFPEA
jgi:hypothetical protein